MKLLKYTTLALALLGSSCSTSFLEVEPIGQMGKEQLFSDVNGMRDALVGSYNLTAGFFHSSYGIYGDLRADDVERAIGGTQNFMLSDYNYNFDETDQLGSTQNIWSTGYEVLNNVNNVIAAAEALKTAEPHRIADIQSYEGQAHILRALMFFALSNVYSQHYTYTTDGSHPGIPLPLKTPLPSELVARSSMKETYAQIVDDLKKGESMLAGLPTQTRIYASADAAKALLSRVYLYMANYDGVIAESSAVLSTNKYRLATASEYKDMFIGNGQSSGFAEINPEVLWQFTYSTRVANSVTNFYSNPAVFVAYPKGSFLALYTADDVRKNMFEYQAASKQFMSLKNGKNAGVTDLNWPLNSKVIRSAELYLNRAEAYLHKQQLNLAEEDLKTVMARALGKKESDIQLSYSGAEALLKLIKEERRKELAFEGHRIFDVMRYKETLNRGTGCNSAVCTLQYPSDIFILPIPKAELDANKLITPNPTVNN